MSAAAGSVAGLIPHTGDMQLLSDVLEHDALGTRCRVALSRSRLFADDAGRVPAWLAIEYMAQCIAVHGGIEARAHGVSLRAGLLLGSRRVSLHVDHFALADELEVSAVHVRGSGEGGGLASFDCALRRPGDERELATARIGILIRDDGERPGSSKDG